MDEYRSTYRTTNGSAAATGTEPAGPDDETPLTSLDDLLSMQK